MKYATQKIKQEVTQCSLCAAKFEIWLDNTRINDERKERVSQNMLSYCPACRRVDEKSK